MVRFVSGASGNRDHPSDRVIAQRIRNRVIECLEVAASFEKQVEYALAVPYVNVPYEVINGYEDWVSADPRTNSDISPVYSSAEADVLGTFHDAWNVAADALSDDFPSVAEAQSMPEWVSLRTAAQAALAVFEQRGRLSEESEVEW